MSRQCLNVEVAVQLALAAGHDWLLHIDADELFDCPGQDAGAHFARLAAQGFDRAVYPNLEALPKPPTSPTSSARSRCSRRTATRCRAACSVRARRRWRRAIRSFPGVLSLLFQRQVRRARPPAGLVLPTASVVSGPGVPCVPARRRRRRPGPGRECIVGDCRILHYAHVAGYANFRNKYRILGAFSDRWFGRVDIRGSIGDFHLRARDIVAGGDEERARAFYRQHAMLGDPDAVRD